MARRPPRKLSTRRDPPGDSVLPCVWMQAGILSYRLCDRDYDCEGCSLDAALRGVQPVPARGSRSGRWEFPDDRLYHPNHGWIQPLGGRCARVGLDALAIRLLDRLSAVVLPAPGAHLGDGDTMGWFVDEGVPIPVRAAVRAVVQRVNPGLRTDPERILTAPYGDGWLLELGCATDPGSLPHLETAEAVERRAARQLQDLARRVGLSSHDAAEVGPTLADGGEPTARLRETAGPDRYHRLIVALLGG